MIGHWDDERLGRLKQEVDTHLDDYLDIWPYPRRKLMELCIRRVPATRPFVVDRTYRALVEGLMDRAIEEAQQNLVKE